MASLKLSSFLLTIFTLALSICYTNKQAIADINSSSTQLNSIIVESLSIKDALLIVTSQYNYKLNYKGLSESRPVSLQINRSNLKESIIAILHTAKFQNYNLSIDKNNRIVNIRTLKSASSTRSSESNFTVNKGEIEPIVPLTKENIYALKEETAKEESRQKKMSTPLTFEQLEKLEHYTRTETEKLRTMEQPLSNEQIELLSRHSKTVDDYQEQMTPENLLLFHNNKQPNQIIEDSAYTAPKT